MAKQSQIGNWGTRRLYDAVIQDYEGIGTIDEFHTNLESDENITDLVGILIPTAKVSVANNSLT